MADETRAEVYRLHVWIGRISPMIWRRLLVRSDRTIADLHYTLQTAFGWSDEHLHRFQIHSQDHGVDRAGGILFTADSSAVRLSSFQFRLNESFRYEYDFIAGRASTAQGGGIEVPAPGLFRSPFAGFFLYIGASDLVPESYHEHPKGLTTAMTILGALTMFVAIQLANG